MLKKSIPKISIMPVGAIFFTPSIMIGPKSDAKPPKRAKIIGISIRAVNGNSLLDMIRYINTIIIVKPKVVSMVMYVLKLLIF
jgi:hypothetical protein